MGFPDQTSRKEPKVVVTLDHGVKERYKPGVPFLKGPLRIESSQCSTNVLFLRSPGIKFAFVYSRFR